MGSLLEALKKGNTSSLAAALGNTAIAIMKGVAAGISGSGAMFASAMHSVADAINQGFVFAGSVLAERKPTKKFPTGFGRVINIFCMIAVIVVSIMAYETIKEGFHLLSHPVHATNFWLNFIVLLIAIVVDGVVWFKAMKEIVHETRVEAKGLQIFTVALRNVGRASPPTRLVFYEDVVATLGSTLALVAVLLATFTDIQIFDGVATILIGILMIGVVFKVGYDNMVGLIGVAAPKDIEDRVAAVIMSDPQVTDIYRLRIVQEGRTYHVEGYIELQKGLTLADADDIKFRVRDKLMSDPDISDALLAIIEDDGVKSWGKLT